MLVVVDLPGVQRHPQPDPLLAWMRAVVRVQRCDQCGRQRFHQQALGQLSRNQDEHTVASVLVTAAIPRDTGVAKRFLHGTVQAVTNRHLMPVGTPLIPEPLNVNNDYGPVNGQPLVLYLPSPPVRQGRTETSINL